MGTVAIVVPRTPVPLTAEMPPIKLAPNFSLLGATGAVSGSAVWTQYAQSAVP